VTIFKRPRKDPKATNRKAEMTKSDQPHQPNYLRATSRMRRTYRTSIRDIINWHSARVVPAQAAFRSTAGMLNPIQSAAGHTSEDEVTFADILEG
jgi:hypothetical protein